MMVMMMIDDDGGDGSVNTYTYIVYYTHVK